MISLTPMEYDENILKQYIYNSDGVTPTKGNEILHANITFIQERINDYQSNINSFSPLLVYRYTNDILKKKLYDIYDSTSQNIETLKTNIRNLSTTICPYCGIQSAPYQIDHYLPRESYPEFSILSDNLIPSCAICNSKYKGTKYISDDNYRLFYNPYFDNFVNGKQFLKCNLWCEDTYLMITFYIDDPDSEEEYKIIKNHFDKLKLNERYQEIVTKDLFPEFYNEFVEYDEELQKETFIDTEVTMLKQVIDGRIRGLRTFNQNYWRKVFWIALKECDDCLNLIVEKKIPLG